MSRINSYQLRLQFISINILGCAKITRTSCDSTHRNAGVCDKAALVTVARLTEDTPNRHAERFQLITVSRNIPVSLAAMGANEILLRISAKVD